MKVWKPLKLGPFPLWSLAAAVSSSRPLCVCVCVCGALQTLSCAVCVGLSGKWPTAVNHSGYKKLPVASAVTHPAPPPSTPTQLESSCCQPANTAPAAIVFLNPPGPSLRGCFLVLNWFSVLDHHRSTTFAGQRHTAVSMETLLTTGPKFAKAPSAGETKRLRPFVRISLVLITSLSLFGHFEFASEAEARRTSEPPLHESKEPFLDDLDSSGRPTSG